MCRWLIELSAVALLASTLACASPGTLLDRRASRAGLEVLTLEGGEFHLRGYLQSGVELSREGRLRIYLEGDGVPWIGGNRIARDPHGSRNVAFELMRLDPHPALYLERPCYHALNQADPCRPELWTMGRYSPEVVSSLETALRSWLETRHPRPLASLQWIGYSGGGTLAMLLAPRFAASDLVVTVAGNLDLAAWTEHHGYLPLSQSLDPARQPPLAASIRQIHLAGRQDANVPPRLVEPVVARQPAAEWLVYEDLGHADGWAEVWPAVLESVTLEAFGSP